MKKLLAGLLWMAGAGLVTGCLVPARVHVRSQGPLVEYGYTPILFSGYVVYYADGGIPFIWLHGSQYWIPDSYRPTYVAHYHQHQSAYHVWYQHRGDTYRGHRYTNRQDDGRRLQKATDRRPVPQPALRRADDRRPVPQPALRRADDRRPASQPALHRSPEVQPQPKAEPTPGEPGAVKPEAKKKPKPRKSDDDKRPVHRENT
jgi:hypothetical protein